MDILQIAIVFLIVVVAILLLVMGLQVFLVLKGLKRSVDKFDNIVGNVVGMTEDIKKPIHAMADMSGAVDAGVKFARAIASKNESARSKARSLFAVGTSNKPARRIFKVSKKE